MSRTPQALLQLHVLGMQARLETRCVLQAGTVRHSLWQGRDRPGWNTQIPHQHERQDDFHAVASGKPQSARERSYGHKPWAFKWLELQKLGALVADQGAGIHGNWQMLEPPLPELSQQTLARVCRALPVGTSTCKEDVVPHECQEKKPFPSSPVPASSESPATT